MSEKYYTEFYKGDLIKLREGIIKYPYYKTLELFKENPRLNMYTFGSEQLVVLDKVYNKKGALIGYECLCSSEKVFIMNVEISDNNKLDVGFCYVIS